MIFFHLLFIHVVWEVNWLDVFESKPFVFFFRDHLRSSMRITCGFGIICVWVRKLRRVFRLPTSNFRSNKKRSYAYTTFTLFQNAACSSNVFSFCRVDYALEGSTFFMSKCDLSRLFHTERPGGVRTTIAKHHGRYSKSDHLCQDGVEWTSRLRSEYSFNYAAEIYDFALNLFRKLLKNKVCRILREKNRLIPSMSVLWCVLFVITCILFATGREKSAQNRFVQCFSYEKHRR